jgi:predicted nucleic acid-binding protein
VPAYFFDTSALAKLYHQEAGSDRVEELVRNPAHRILISRLAVVEMHSVFALKVRSQAIDADDATALRRRFLSDIRSGVFEVLALAQTHYERAERLISSYGFHYGLRTLDALQLSVAAELPKSILDHIVASDRALSEVATLESFSVIDPEHS